MPTAVYDASYITFRNRAKTLYAFNNVRQTAVNSGASVRPEQAAPQTAEVIITRKQGGCFCSNDAAGLSITRQGEGACSCGR
jgi:hypothetical protein